VINFQTFHIQLIFAIYDYAEVIFIKINNYRELSEARNYKVVKANELIQQSRFNLQAQEQKIILYLISKIKSEDIELKEHTFEIKDFCKVCGLDDDNGKNYKNIKDALKGINDKSIWISLENGKEAILQWFDYVIMDPRGGVVNIKISDRMKPYLLQLEKRFTEYQLLYTLGMKSQYSIRLYELLKSYEFRHKKLFEIEELKMRLSAEIYNRFPDFRRYVLESAVNEINRLSDLTVTYDLIKESRKYTKVEFSMKRKEDLDERIETLANINEIINSKKKLRGTT